MRYFFATVFSFLLSAPLVFSQPFWTNPDMRAAKEAADQRNIPELLSHLDKSEALDAFVLYTLASVQSDSAINAILRKLSSPSARVREYAAFALGQTLRLSPAATRFEDTVLTHLASESNRAVRYELIVALGHFGSRSALEKLLALNLKDRVLKDAIAEAIARAALRRVVSETLTAAVASLYAESARSPMFNFALYALSRIADSTLLAPHQRLILDALQSPFAEHRATAALAASALRTPESHAALLTATRDRDWRVAVSALRALRRAAAPDTLFLNAARGLLQSSSYHLQKEALHLLAQTAPSPLAALSPAFATVLSSVESLCTAASSDLQAAALQALAMLAPDRAASIIEARLSAPSPAVLSAMRAPVAREMQVSASWLALLYASAFDTRSEYATAAIGSLGSLLKAAQCDSLMADSIRHTLTQALVHHSSLPVPNTAPIQLVASILADSLLVPPSFAPTAASAMMNALHHLSSHTDAETVMILLESLARLSAAPALPILERYLSDPALAVRRKAAELLTTLTSKRPEVSTSITTATVDWSFFTRFSRNPLATIETTKGTIVLELFIEEAPFTVQNFIRLAEAKFYDGVRFHRVVPNFVVQGGDPKGDGTGGPPYSIRSEFTRRRFERGMLGMASAGKDTEGSQFFIMHSYHPHLDGRYSAFGLVKKGLDVVDRIEVGDRILSVRIQAR